MGSTVECSGHPPFWVWGVVGRWVWCLVYVESEVRVLDLAANPLSKTQKRMRDETSLCFH